MNCEFFALIWRNKEKLEKSSLCPIRLKQNCRNSQYLVVKWQNVYWFSLVELFFFSPSGPPTRSISIYYNQFLWGAFQYVFSEFQRDSGAGYSTSLKSGVFFNTRNWEFSIDRDFLASVCSQNRMFKRSLRNEVTTLQIGKFIKRLIKKTFGFSDFKLSQQKQRKICHKEKLLS